MKVRREYRCEAIVKPGEYSFTRYDGKQCEETNPRLLMKCQECGRSYCLMTHFGNHECLTQEQEKGETRMAANNTAVITDDPFANPDFTGGDRVIVSRMRVTLDVGDEFRGQFQGMEEVPLPNEPGKTGLYANFKASYPAEIAGEEVAISAGYHIEKILDKAYEGQWVKLVCTRTVPSKKGNDVKIIDGWLA